MSKGPAKASSGVVVQHLVLRVRDIDKSHRFYTEVLGFEQCGQLELSKYGRDMRFYRGDPNHHHDIALVQIEGADAVAAPEPWMMLASNPGIDHIAMCYPDRQTWLSQIAWMKSQDVEFIIRGNHGMTHSVYIADPDGNGIEVLYNLPEEVWSGDVNAALNYFDQIPLDSPDLLEDDTNYRRFEPAS